MGLAKFRASQKVVLSEYTELYLWNVPLYLVPKSEHRKNCAVPQGLEHSPQVQETKIEFSSELFPLLHDYYPPSGEEMESAR